MQYVFSTTGLKRYRFPTHVNELVMDRSQATVSEVFLVVLEPGEAPPLHMYPDTAQVYYLLEGRGTLSIGAEREPHPVSAGEVVRVPPGVLHSIRAEGGRVRYLAVDCLTGRDAKLEPTWDEHVRVVCRQQGWQYDEVI